MDIVIIGTGNTATVLGKKLFEAGHSIVQIAGRNAVPAKVLADQLHAPWTTDITNISSKADLYLLAVSDNAIASVVDELPLTNKILVHTAASVPLSVLKMKTVNHGIFYPLQSLNKNVAQTPEIPIIIDAGNEATLQALHQLANTISGQVIKGNDDMRLKLHLAAVVVNNFTNHLFTLVENYCRSESLDFSLLLPLMAETVERLNAVSPSVVQTGPALRNDTATIAKHLELLQLHPTLHDLYSAFTNSIQQSGRL